MYSFLIRRVVYKGFIFVWLLTFVFVENNHVIGQSSTNDLSHRYVIFLGGVNSSSSLDKPVARDFYVIETSLRINLGIKPEQIIYFSYSAIATTSQDSNANSRWCLGWGDRNCSDDSSNLFGLKNLNATPIYSSSDTHQSIPDQAKALSWLIGQLVKKDPSAKIDLIGYSLGGIVASYWAATVTDDSDYRNSVNSLTLIESPVGGFPLGQFSTAKCGINPVCGLHRDILTWYFGRIVLDQLQLPESSSNSIIDILPKAADNFPLVSIESTTDYFVNSVSMPLCGLACINSEQAPVGRGTQYWIQSARTLHNTHELGGQGLASEPLKRIPAMSLLQENHSAPLRHQQTALWVIEAVIQDKDKLVKAEVKDDKKVYLGSILLFDTDREAPGCFGVGDISYSPTSAHFLILLDCLEGDNDAFIFRSDGSNKRQITGEWDYINYHNYEWSEDGTYLLYERINSCCAPVPPNAPPRGWVKYDVVTGEKTLDVTFTGARPDAVVSTETLNVRSGPGTSYNPPIAQIHQGDELIVLGRNSGCSWINVIAPNNIEGWVAAGSQYITLNILCDSVPLAEIPLTRSPQLTPPPTSIPSPPTAIAQPQPVPARKVLFDDDPRNNRYKENNYFCSGFQSDCEFGNCPVNAKITGGPFCRGVDYSNIKPGLYEVTFYGTGTVAAGATDYSIERQLFTFGRQDGSLPIIHRFCWPGWQEGMQGFETIAISQSNGASINRIAVSYLGLDCAGTPVEVARPNPPSSSAAQISFTASREQINVGECATLRWDVDNVQAVYVDEEGVTGHGSKQVCPPSTKTYHLNVVDQDGEQEERSVTVTVQGTIEQPPSTALEFEVDVHSVEGWQDTNIKVHPGQTIAITYLSGRWSVCPPACPYVTAEGWFTQDRWATPDESRNWPDNNISGCPHGALIARLNSQSFCVENSSVLESHADATLELRINDRTTGDNGGSISVHVTVQ